MRLGIFLSFIIFGWIGFDCEAVVTRVDQRVENTAIKKSFKIRNRPDCWNGVNTTLQLSKLRDEMRKYNVSVYIISSNDEHQSEYVSKHDRRREYISGFSGSAGTAAVTLNSAGLATDSRYTIQAENQLDCNWDLIVETDEVTDWILSQVKPGERVSSDPKLIDKETWEMWSALFNMVLTEENLVDKIWGAENGQEPYPNVPLFTLDVQYAGLTWQEKLKFIRGEMNGMGRDVLILNQLDEIAWTLNLRGGDIPFTPVFMSYLIISMNESVLYVRPELITEIVEKHLNSDQGQPGDSVKVIRDKQFWSDLKKVGQTANSISLSAQYSYVIGVSYFLYSSLPKDKVNFDVSPVLGAKNQKNRQEVDSMKFYSTKDSVAICQVLYELERDVTSGSGEWTELRVVDALEYYRSKQMDNFGPSFDTIAGFEANGAMPHYSPSEETNKQIDNSSLLVIDSGGQYYGCTTDVTRTMHYGTPTDEQMEIYTRLLKGCIDLVTTVFPFGKTQLELDIIIRKPLLEIGLTFGHGTTHGIGSFLIVHEAFNQTYQKNFFGSQEPGYYKKGEYGMRLENMVRVVEAKTKYETNPPFLTFETITLVPYEKNLIKLSLLDRHHIDWINKYHERILKEVGGDMLNQQLNDVYKWLVEKTKPIEVVNI